uniref:Uncharacterized protein n=1 Tax=Romanomermis culicivorax TaxID=13658 RepID=A0A915KCG5_ROMCU
MSIVSKNSKTSLKLLDDLIKLRLITDKALDTKAVSDNDSDRAKTPRGDLGEDGDKSVASDGSAISNKSFSSTNKCRQSSSHGSSVIEDTPPDNAPASNDPQAVMPEFLDDHLVKRQRLSLQPKTKLIANPELWTQGALLPGTQGALLPDGNPGLQHGHCSSYRQ